MIVFDAGDVRFNYRVGGACIRDGRVLLARDDGSDFWYMPGGRCELMEASADTLAREMREELGAAVGVGRLLWVIENFFGHLGRRWHELAFYYAIELPPGSPYLDGTREHRGSERGGEPFTLRWFRLDDLDDVELYPSILRRGLREPREGVRHAVHRDEGV